LFEIEAIRRTARSGRRLFLLLVGRRNVPLRDPKFLLIFALLFVGGLPVVGADSLTLKSDSEVSTAGFFHLSWNAANLPDGIKLLESHEPGFLRHRIVYQGPDLARTMSGKANGDYYYQVIAASHGKSQASNIVKVTVAHHSLRNAFLFFTVGAVVFLAILFSVVLGNRGKNNQ
jgi:hypothetical protein